MISIEQPKQKCNTVLTAIAALSLSLRVSCKFGFPGTLIIPEEVANSQGNAEEE